MSPGSTQYCQSCRTAAIEVAVANDVPEQPYLVCRACEYRLSGLALRPLEWFNLAAIHGPWKFLLHDDFYDCSFENYGAATIPEVELVEQERFPAPTVEQVREDLERLIDYAMTCHYLEGSKVEPLLVAICTATVTSEQKERLLGSLQRRIAESARNVAIEGSSYRLCARCLGPSAADWVRQQWAPDRFRKELLFSLSEATARCLPFEEGWGYVMERLEAQAQDIYPLTAFRTSRTLDWMEENRAGASTNRWGQVAALSQFSWPRAQAWLDSGRPLAHVALAALQSFPDRNAPPSPWRHPLLEEPAPVEEMVAALNAYAERDNVPNVRKRVAAIVAALIEPDKG